MAPFLQGRAEAQLGQLEKIPFCLASPFHARAAVLSSDFGSLQQDPKHWGCSQAAPARVAEALQPLPAVFLLRLGHKDGFNLTAFAQPPFRVCFFFFFSHRLPRAQHSFDNFYKSSSVLVICGYFTLFLTCRAFKSLFLPACPSLSPFLQPCSQMHVERGGGGAFACKYFIKYSCFLP